MAGPGRVGAAIAALLLAGAGCGRRALSEEEKRAQAQEAVQRFFAALPGQDCAVLGAMLALRPGGEDCPSAVDALQRHGFRLLEVLGAEVDGRDPEAVIVRVRMEENGRPRAAPLRVERHPGGWKLRL